MAIKLSANYSKKLGLPQYSSHSFSASVEVELADITQMVPLCGFFGPRTMDCLTLR